MISDSCGLPSVFTKPGDTSVITCEIGNEDEIPLAINSYGHEVNEGGEDKIYYSHIVYYGDLMDSLSYDEKKTIALHELGHTFGLRDYSFEYESEVDGYSVMYGMLTHNYDDYTEGDQYNLEWYYTNGGN